MPGFHCCAGFSLVAESWGCSLVAVHRLLIVVASVVEEHGLQGMGAPGVVAHELCSVDRVSGL